MDLVKLAAFLARQKEREHAPRAVKTGLDRTALTFRLAVSDRGEVTDTHTGEVLAWAKGRPADKLFFVK